MIFYYLVLGSAAVLGIIVIALGFSNTQTVGVSLLSAKFTLPFGACFIGSWLAGLTASAAVWQSKISAVRSEKKLEKWQIQDDKLLKEVQTDQVKLLEAKIATLETALRSALKKKESQG